MDHLQIDLPEMLPRAVAPRTGLPVNADESDLLFEAIFRRNHWQLSLMPGFERPPPYPAEWFHRSDRTRITSEFLAYLEYVIAGILAPAVPHPLTANMAPLRKSYPRLAPEVLMLPLFRRLLRRMRELGLTPLARYRVLLGARWLVGQLDLPVYSEEFIISRKSLMDRPVGVDKRDHRKFKSDRLERTRTLLGQLLNLWGIDRSGWPRKRESGPAPRGPTGTQLDSADLPHHMLWWPESIKDLARAILILPAGDLDAELQQAQTEFAFMGMQQEYAGVTAGPTASQRRDPTAVATVRALEAVLDEEIQSATDRRAFICQVLDAYPRDYLSPRSPARPRPPSARWNPKTIPRWLRS